MLCMTALESSLTYLVSNSPQEQVFVQIGEVKAHIIGHHIEQIVVHADHNDIIIIIMMDCC